MGMFRIEPRTGNRILGIDPGTRSTGLGLIEHSGDKAFIVELKTVKTPKGLGLIPSIVAIFNAVTVFAKISEPDLIVMEDFRFQGRSITAAGRGVDRLVGALSLLSRQWPLSLLEARDWKPALVGVRCKASEEAVKYVVELRTGYRFKRQGPHVIDAAGIALVGGDRENLGFKGRMQ